MEEGKANDNFLTRLKVNSKNCNCNNSYEDEVIIDKVILSCTDPVICKSFTEKSCCLNMVTHM